MQQEQQASPSANAARAVPAEKLSVTMNLLQLNQGDFPDVCIQCDQCMTSIKVAIRDHTMAQIKDADIAQMFIEAATAQLLKFIREREEASHR